MRILALVPPDPKGRTPSRYTFLSEELGAFVDFGHEVHTVSPYISDRTRLRGIRVHPTPRIRHVTASVAAAVRRRLSHYGCPASDLSWVQRLSLAILCDRISQVARENRIDVVYSPFAWPHGTGGTLTALEFGIPVVVSLRGVDALIEPDIGFGRCLAPLWRQRLSWTLQRARRVIGVSTALANRAVELGTRPQSVRVVLKGTDLRHFRPGNRDIARQSLGLDNRPIVLFVGGLVPYKRVLFLLKAMQYVWNASTETLLVLVGDGPDRNDVIQFLRAHGHESRVIMTGRVPRTKMPLYFQACDLHVLPSIGEGSGNVLVEASASARPSVGTAWAGIPDYIDDGLTGYLFPRDDVRALAQRIGSLVSDREMSRKMGLAARRRAETRHSYETMIGTLISTFEECLEGVDSPDVNCEADASS